MEREITKGLEHYLKKLDSATDSTVILRAQGARKALKSFWQGFIDTYEMINKIEDKLKEDKLNE